MYVTTNETQCLGGGADLTGRCLDQTVVVLQGYEMFCKLKNLILQLGKPNHFLMKNLAS